MSGMSYIRQQNLPFPQLHNEKQCKYFKKVQYGNQVVAVPKTS